MFDGHGGAFTAKYAATELVSIFTHTQAWTSQELSLELLTTALIDSFLQLDLNLAQVPAMQWKKEQTEDKSGSTAVVAVVTNSHVVVANCGDCRGLLVKSTPDGTSYTILPLSFSFVLLLIECMYVVGWVSVALSVDHKPNLEAEKARIEATGSTIELVGDSWRVNGSLAVARALGDFAFKQCESVSLTEQAVTALPEVMSHELAEEDTLLMMACDGIWDVMSNEDMAIFLQTKLKVCTYLISLSYTCF